MNKPYQTVPFVKLRVLAEYDEKYKTHVAYCLETGSVVTSDDPNALKDEMKELLEDELMYALETKNLTNLFSSPAPFDKWIKWQEAAKKTDPEPIPLLIESSARKGQQGVRTEVEVELARAA